MLAQGTLNFGIAPLQMLPALWPQLKSMIESHDGGWLDTVEPVEVISLVVGGKLDVWAAFDGMELVGGVIAGLEDHGKKSFYQIYWLGGSGGLDRFILPGLEKIEKYALDVGASEVVALGRKGWERKLKPYGYGVKYTQVRKDVRKA